MQTSHVRELKDCNQFLQTIQARPPRFVHGLALLLIGLVATATAWAAITRVNLVVASTGRVRPTTAPQKVSVARTDGSAATVAEVFYTQGQEVREGDVLLRLNTEKLQNELARKRRVIQAVEEELEKGERLAALQQRLGETAVAKLDAEIAEATEDVKREAAARAAERRLAEAELKDAGREEDTLTRLAADKVVSVVDLQKAQSRCRELRAKLEKANLPVEDGKVAVLRKARLLAEDDRAARRQEETIKRSLKVAELETARIELSNLDIDLKHAEVRAPRCGVVTSPELKVGDVVEPGKTVVEIAERGSFRIEFPVNSDEIDHLVVGMPVKFKLDAFDYQKYGTLDGTLEFIAPDSIVVDGRPGAVYMVRATVSGTAVGRGPMIGQLKLGMACQVELVTGEDSVLDLMFKKIRSRVRLK